MSDKGTQSMLVTHRERYRYGFVNKRTILGILTIACFSIASLLYGIRTMKDGPERSATGERSESMFLTKQKSAANHEIPPIDVPTVGKTEAATFALG